MLEEQRTTRAIGFSPDNDYTAARRLEPKRRKKGGVDNGGPRVSPATVNKELRAIRAMFRKAVRMGYLVKAPEFEFLKEPGKLPTYVTPEHFAALYPACDTARWPTPVLCGGRLVACPARNGVHDRLAYRLSAGPALG